MSTLNLSNVHPDQTDLKIQFEAFLNTQDAWKGVVTSQTGQGIISLVSAVGAFDQASIRRKFQDSFPDTVVSDRAAYALSAMQGVRLARKLPAGVQVNLKSTAIAISVPAYTIFQGSGAFFFNREALFLPADTTVSVTLYEGSVLRYSMPGIDEPYALFVSSETAFTVSDIDVEVLLNDSPMSRATGGLWTLNNQLGFGDSTLPEGKLMIQFGNAKFGGQPSNNDTVYITYVTTNGADANSLDCLGKLLTVTNYPTVSGAFTGNPTGGANERSAIAYKNIAAPTFGVFDSAINKQQHISMALQFPGVVDVIPFAQREINPSALEWMNVIKLVLYTSSPWSESTKAAFLSFMQSKCAYAPHFVLDTPVIRPVDVIMDIYCYNWANSTQAKLNVETAITALFAPRIGMLNYDLHMSDIITAAQDSDPGVEYVVLKDPTEDILISGQSVPTPVITLQTGGTFDVGSYYYGVQVTTVSGIISPRNFAQYKILSGNTNAFELTWDAVTDAVSYQIYRKSPSDLRPGLVNVVAGNAPRVYLDMNTVPAGAPPQAQNTVPVKYTTLNSLLVTDYYSARSIRN